MKKYGEKKESRIRTAAWIVFIFFLFFVLTLGFNLLDLRFGNDFFRSGEAIGALIAAILVVNELRKDAEAEERESKIQQSTFIKDFNQAFITNPDMVFVERALEEYYGAFRDFVDEKGRVPTQNDMAEQNKKLEYLFNKPGTYSRQRLINYLVYLEGLATVLSNEAMDIENVDSLLGYRFFIAVNNPVVQELELNRFENDYRGIHTLGQDWVDHRRNRFSELSKEEQNRLSKKEVKYGDNLIPMQKKGFSFKTIGV